MKKFLALVLVCGMLTGLGGLTVAAETDYTGLIEECLTTEVKTAISKNLALPNEWEGTPITWESSNAAVIENDGTVHRAATDQTVTLTAKEGDAVVKELTYTVLGKGKKVWYSENFYYPNDAGQELRASDEASTKPVEFVEAAGEEPGRAGFYKYHNSSLAAKYSAKLAESPFKAGDYALRLASDQALYYAKFMLPGTELPTGKVTVTMDVLAETESDFGTGRCQYINVLSDSDNSQGAGKIGYLAAGAQRVNINDSSTGSGQSAAAAGIEKTTSGTKEYFKSTMTIVADYTSKQVTATVAANNATGTATGDFQLATAANFKHLTIYNRAGASAAVKPAVFYIDNMVITTDEISGDTPAERVATYKSILTDRITAAQDTGFITEDIDLNVMSEFSGYDVTWSSSDESILAVDNTQKKATVKLAEITRKVNLIAEITHQGAVERAEISLVVQPKGAALKSLTAAGETGVVTFEGVTGKPYWMSLTPGYETDASYGNVMVLNSANATYGPGSYTGSISGTHKTVSVDLNIQKPANNTAIAPSIVLVQGGGSGTSQIAYVLFNYSTDDEGNLIGKTMYIYNGSGYTTIYDKTPEPGAWFNLQIVTNNQSGTYDVYIDREIVQNAASTYFKSHAIDVDGTIKYNNNLYQIRFNPVMSGKANATMKVDNISIITNESEWVTAASDLALAGVESPETALITTGTNGTAINWSATGDISIDEGQLIVRKGIGQGQGSLTATAGTASGNLSRIYNLTFPLNEWVKVVDVSMDADTLTSVTVNSEQAADGYIAFYVENGARMVGIDTFAITTGTNTYSLNYPLPQFDSYRVFAFTDSLQPLSSAPTIID